MDTEIHISNHRPSIAQRLLPAIVPVLLVAVGYVDPGKWAAVVEAGAHFGSDLALLMFVFNLAAILCQYLSARIALVTGRDLSQICSEEYDKATCISLGVLTEISMIALDLSMVLGTAHGLNLLFAVDLLSGVFLAAVGAILYPFFATLLDNGKAKFVCILTTSFILLFYVLGVLFSQPEISFTTSGTLAKLSGESAFALMSLLGANIMPHNFYLHSSIVQKEHGSHNVSKGLLCHDHFFAILCIFSGIFLVNYVLMNAAADVFYSRGLVLLTFQDALSLMDQVFRSSIVPFAFLLVLFISNQITALTWNLGRQAVLHDFFGLEIPGWLRHVTIRIIAIIPALYCVWNSGAEGIYQLLIFMQVVVALMLPSSVIPLFRIASSRSVMGTYKISQFVEFLALIVFFGMLGLKIIFLVEMVFGNSEWVGNMKWTLGSSMSLSYVVLLVAGSASLCLMLWLAATPLKSASSGLDDQVWYCDVNDANPELAEEKDESDTGETYAREESLQKEDALGEPIESHSNMSVKGTDLNLPETLLDSDAMPHLKTIEDSIPEIAYVSPSKFHPEESTTTVEPDLVTTVYSEVPVSESVDSMTLKKESSDMVEKAERTEGDLQTGKDDEGDTWEPEESFNGAPAISPSLTSDGPGSYKSLSGRSEEGGSGTGSLSRLSGLGRGARRQLTTILDEFWVQLFDFHGNPVQEAKAKKLDVLLGLDSKVDSKPTTRLKMEVNAKELTGYFPSVGGRSDSLMKPSVYDSHSLLGMQGNIEASSRLPRGPSSSWSSQSQLLDAYASNSSYSALDSFGRRYSSVRYPPASEGNDYQPATIHGYQMASYLSRIAKEKNSEYLNGQMEALTPKSPSLGASNYRNPPAFTSVRKPQNGLSTPPPGFSKPVISRNISLQSERSLDNDLCTPGPGPAENVNSSVHAKKFHSSPDISSLSLPYRNLYLSDRSAQLDGSIGYGSSLHATGSLKAGVPYPFDHLSPSKPYRDLYASRFSLGLDTGSLWSTQPFEQFGVANNTNTAGSEEVQSKQSSITPETEPFMDVEAKLLQSFRLAIVKLLKLEGSDWLFRQNDGADEDLIGRVAARERYVYEPETREMNRVAQIGEPLYSFDRKQGSALKNDEIDHAKFLVSSFPNCGEGCVWRLKLIISFGVWCIHRILELSLMESRPELWGKYTYVLNRLQGIINPGLVKPRTPMTPCLCLHIPATQLKSSPPPIPEGGLPPPAKQGRGKCTTAAMLFEKVKDVETAISCRKGRSGTTAGDVAFPKGKENLASVLKRYKRRLSGKPVGAHEGGPAGSRKAPSSAPYGS
ncbi:ethylene-insensitive protein 2-like [Diospyros lotus]|uniref:ethylene-insensitive protein 2-like n=1 Tax=Diospyros lotus TaxID=55363 RepID=UPI00225A46C5|nr:ethylene-insensitive protein 2-like [Diospyros lotus]XP_052174930.1 ethylene-insensitive protein 2-like [Diospyros lotus]XP_052174932.1 ethylene-insensitive protein 2-like [Diospyros lotus]